MIVLFSGCDIIGNLLQVPRFLAQWNITQHLEWWADRYQYSSMTTQLFWVPNHALGGWLVIGLLLRAERGSRLESVLPIVVAAVALWSPLAALGVVPFVLWHLFAASASEHTASSWRWLLDPRIWAPALVVGIAVAAYLTLDADRIPKGWTVGNHGEGAAAIAMDLARQVEFFLLEAGLIGFAILALRRSLPAGLAGPLVLALVILALLPLVSFRRVERPRDARLDSEPHRAGDRRGSRPHRGRTGRGRPAQEGGSRCSAGGRRSDADSGVRACCRDAFLADQPAGDGDRHLVRISRALRGERCAIKRFCAFCGRRTRCRSVPDRDGGARGSGMSAPLAFAALRA